MGSMAAPILPSLEDLSLPEQIAQMVVVRASGHLFDHEIQYPAWEASHKTLTTFIQKWGVGGVILLGGSAAEVGLRTQQLQSLATIPLLVAADIEEGVGQRFSGATWFPPPMALEAIATQDRPGALLAAEQMGAVTAQEAIALGINWLLAPVVDVNNNPANPVINVRAFGQSPQRVQALTTAFIRGAQTQPVLTTAKHFPGHGDTTLDSHLALPQLPHTLERLQQVEFEPFRGAIAAGVDAVMTAHLQVPALDPHYPATLSPATLTGLLRQTLGFEGLIVTDALVMGAITRTYTPYEAAVLAVEAGADILLMPPDVEGAIQAIEEAVTIGRISAERIQASVERIWRAKQKAASPLAIPPESCHSWEDLPPPPVQLDLLAQPRARQVAQEILQGAATYRGTLPDQRQGSAGHPAIAHGQPAHPVTNPSTAGNLLADNIILVDDVLNCPFLGRTVAAIALPEHFGYGLNLIDHRGCWRLPTADGLRPSLLQLFIRGNPFRSSADLTQIAESWFQALLRVDALVGLVVYGSPYVLDHFRPLLPPACPFGFTYGQMPEAQTQILSALFGLETPSEEDHTSLRHAAFTD